MSGTFSKLLGLGSFKDAPIFYEAPKKLRIGLWNLIEDLVDHKIPPTALPYCDGLYNKVTAALHIERIERPDSKSVLKDLVLITLEWNELFDLIQYLFTEVFYYEDDERGFDWAPIPAKFSDARYNFTVKINDIFKNNNIGWKLKNGFFERTGNEVLESEVIAKAKLLLGNPDFVGPNSEFNKALEFLNKRPRPDFAGCATKSVSALEGLVRILLKNNKITLGDATNLMVGKKIIRKPFDKTFHALYGFVSSEPGLRHGAHVLSTIDLSETEFILYNSAVCMVFLASRLGAMPIEDKSDVLSPKVFSKSLPTPVKKPVISDFPEEEFPEKEPPEEGEDSEFPPEDDEVPF